MNIWPHCFSKGVQLRFFYYILWVLLPEYFFSNVHQIFDGAEKNPSNALFYLDKCVIHIYQNVSYIVKHTNDIKYHKW